MAYTFNFKLEEQLGRAMNILIGPKPLRDRLAVVRAELHELRPAGHLSPNEAPSTGFADRFNDLVKTLDQTRSWHGKGIRDGHLQRAKQVELASAVMRLFEELCRASASR